MPLTPPRKSADMGIDGFSFFEHNPIQVKQSEHVGRNVVDNFETPVERSGKKKGEIVAFSFTKGAYEEAARVKKAKGLEIKLVTVEEILERRADLVTPEPGALFPEEATLPEPRPKEALPSVDELIQSDRRA